MATDLTEVSSEQIAQMYKARWQVEVFFRWIKQNLNVPNLFGTTENAVYGQLYEALIAYVIFTSLFESAKKAVPKHVELSSIRFFSFVSYGTIARRMANGDVTGSFFKFGFSPKWIYIIRIFNRRD